MEHRPAYLDLPEGELAERARRAVAALADCRLCPRDCGVDRLEGEIGVCRTGRHAVVSSAFPHFGEEDCLRGWRGSGTIFFGHCNLRCVFCQNYDISQGLPKSKTAPPGMPADDVADLMLELQDRGCHNVNFVTPEHNVPQVVEAIHAAAARGLRLPVVYNTSAYDDLESLRLLDGLIDVYMPDFKVWSPDSARRHLLAADYPDAARAAIQEMHRQVGPLTFDDRGLAVRGLLVRHLVMPNGLEETEAILTWIAETLGPDTYVNLMSQYRPAGRVTKDRYPEIARRPSATEMLAARQVAEGLGLRLDRRG